MTRLGLDYDAVRRINPAVVYCSISGYGQTDPRAALPGHDVNYQAWAGALTPEGGAGVMPQLPLADLASGMTAAFGICASILGRRTTGEGTYLDVSMTDVMSTWTGPSGSGTLGGVGRRRTGQRRQPPAQAVPGYGLFTTADGRQVALGVVNEDHFWARLCAALATGRPRRTSTSRSGRHAGTNSSGRCGLRSPRASETNWSVRSSPPAFRCRPSSTVKKCWRPRPSPPSRSGCRHR